MSKTLKLDAVWNEVNARLRKGDINRSLWDAAAVAKPLLVEDDQFIVGLTPGNMRFSGYLTQPQYRVQIERILEDLAERKLQLVVIEGDEPGAWQRLQERQMSQTDRVLEEAEFRQTHKSVLGEWEELSRQLHKLFSETTQRRFPEQLARLLIKCLPIIAEAEDKARAVDPEAELVHFQHLNRSFDKLSSYCDIPATIVALEYLRFRSARQRRQSG
jgi:hypothetical protein